MRAEGQKDLQQYCSFRDEIVIIDRITMKGKRIIIPTSNQGKSTDPAAHESYGHRKDKDTGHKFIYWINMILIKKTVNNYTTCLDFWATQT